MNNDQILREENTREVELDKMASDEEDNGINVINNNMMKGEDIIKKIQNKGVGQEELNSSIFIAPLYDDRWIDDVVAAMKGCNYGPISENDRSFNYGPSISIHGPSSWFNITSK